MKRDLIKSFFVFGLVLILAMSFVSAGWLSDLFVGDGNYITGNVIGGEGSICDFDSDCDSGFYCEGSRFYCDYADCLGFCTPDIYPESDRMATNPEIPRISYWWGKVNQHIDPNSGMWVSAPLGNYGAREDKLEYCQMWYPETVDVAEYKLETLYDWKEIYDRNTYVSTKMTYWCLQPGEEPVIGSFEGGWTRWFDHADPTLENYGDLETLNSLRTLFPEETCNSPSRVECQTLDGKDYTEAGEKVTCFPEVGFYCVNANQDDGLCEDYKVRFFCGDGVDVDEGDDSGCASSEDGDNPDVNCYDGIDNDCDGLVDSADDDCPNYDWGNDGDNSGCASSEDGDNPDVNCYDGIDNDCDGLVDSADDDCLDVGGETCVDSDGGLDYYVKGKINLEELGGSDGSNGEDYCFNGEGTPISEEGEYLLEWFCCGGICSDNEIYTCPNGCLDGACVQETTSCETDAECVIKNGFMETPYCAYGNNVVIDTYESFTCSSDGICESVEEAKIIDECVDSSCVEGSCLLSEGGDPGPECETTLDCTVDGEICKGGECVLEEETNEPTECETDEDCIGGTCTDTNICKYLPLLKVELNWVPVEITNFLKSDFENREIIINLEGFKDLNTEEYTLEIWEWDLIGTNKLIKQIDGVISDEKIVEKWSLSEEEWILGGDKKVSEYYVKVILPNHEVEKKSPMLEIELIDDVSCDTDTDCNEILGQVCSDEGSCVASCIDSDGGHEYDVYGTTSGIIFETMLFGTTNDFCNEGNLVESYCEDGFVKGEIVSCGEGFSCDIDEGVCVLDGDEYVPCIDSDGGHEYDVYGTTSGIMFDTTIFGEFKDICFNEDILREAYCEDGFVKGEIVSCGEGYSCDIDEGVCI